MSYVFWGEPTELDVQLQNESVVEQPWFANAAAEAIVSSTTPTLCCNPHRKHQIVVLGASPTAGCGAHAPSPICKPQRSWTQWLAVALARQGIEADVIVYATGYQQRFPFLGVKGRCEGEV